MVNCQNCGFEIDDEAKFCKKCGSEIVIETKESNEFKFCSNCGFKMDENIKFCPECGTSASGVPQTTNAAVSNADKNSALAAILSFLIIGLGQIYLGLTKRGIILFVAAIVAGILTLIIVGWILWLLIWVYAIYDAYNSAEKMKQGLVVEDTLNMDNLF
ncbi:zinc-ribbon domain-containing protein [Methanobrevibacter sp.]